MNPINDEIKDLEERLKNVIVNTCNKIGCRDCDLKYGFDENSECSATDLDFKIHKLRYGSDESVEK